MHGWWSFGVVLLFALSILHRGPWAFVDEIFPAAEKMTAIAITTITMTTMALRWRRSLLLARRK